MQRQPVITESLKAVFACFAIDSAFVTAAPYGNGHINDTFAIETDRRRYLLQRLNTHVFTRPEALIDNVQRVTEHLQRKLRATPGARTAGRLITFEIGIRFLTDYLEGDTYFRIHREHENLERARVQLAFVRDMLRQERLMTELVHAARTNEPCTR